MSIPQTLSKTFEDTEASFQTEVLTADLPVLVDFWATWCPPCKALSPIIDELASEYRGRVKVVKVDVDADQQVAGQYNVSSIPTVILFQNGEVKQRWVGLQRKQDYRSVMDGLE